MDSTGGLRYTNDTDHAGLFNIDGDTRSRNGTMIFYKGMPVGWRSSWIRPGAKGDTAIKLSSGEAETSGAAEGLKLCKHLKHIADDLQMKNTERINLEVDAAVAVSFANNTQCKSKMKQINLNWGWVQELRDQNVVRLIKIPGTENPADCLTKVLNGPAFEDAQSIIKKIRS